MKILHRLTNTVLFEDSESTIKATLINAVEAGANLRGVDLYGADLYDANLSGAEESLQKMQEKSCESCNGLILAMIEGTCGIDGFVDSAIRADGRGHFMSSYDGNEIEVGDLFVYRIN